VIHSSEGEKQEPAMFGQFLLDPARGGPLRG